MPMAPFYTRFRELAFEEMRVVTVLDEAAEVPKGQFGFLELYCDETGCDCRRVHIQVVSPPPETRIWASINYGWETEGFYARWGYAADPAGAAGPFLDPLNEQSEYAPAFLRLFEELALTDETYVRRLIRHYELFKGDLLQRTGNSRARRAVRRQAKRGRR